MTGPDPSPLSGRAQPKLEQPTGPFVGVGRCPPDVIFEATRRYKRDPATKKVNGGIGVYKGPDGETPAFSAVVKAEARFKIPKPGYLPILGYPEFNRQVPELVFGPDSELVGAGKVIAVQAAGGTGSLRLGADFLRRTVGIEDIAVSDPTWANHRNIFNQAGLRASEYPYYDSKSGKLAFEEMKGSISRLPDGSVVLLHACCHNPTGVDPTQEQWRELAQIFKEQKLVPFFDFAYQGFGKGVEQDATAVRIFFEEFGLQGLIAYSFSKSMSLYERRTGALMLVGDGSEGFNNSKGHLEQIVRGTNSNPPADGARIASAVLEDPALREEWLEELESDRLRIESMREKLVSGLKERGHDLSVIAEQNGMFSYTGLTPDEVKLLEAKHIYILPDGRLCVAALTEENINYVIDSIADVLDQTR